MANLIKLQEQLQNERKLVSFDGYDLSVRQVLDMVEEGTIFIPPEYQRQFVWDEERQSALIESVFLGIPVPSLFLATNQDSSWEVVDGVQRVSSLAHFVGGAKLLHKIERDKPLEIKSLEKLSALNDLSFAELPKSVQLHFATRPLRLTVLNDKSDLEVRFDLFERLNTGGVALTAQEIRNCVYRGPFNEDLKELAKTADFRRAIHLGSKPEGGAHEEYVLRFLAYLDRYTKFDHSVKLFLNDYMKENRNRNISSSLARTFKKTFAFLRAALPNGIVRRTSKTPVNLYEAISVGVALVFLDGKQPIAAKIQDLLNDPALAKQTGAGSNQKKYVVGRVEYVRDRAV